MSSPVYKCPKLGQFQLIFFGQIGLDGHEGEVLVVNEGRILEDITGLQ